MIGLDKRWLEELTEGENSSCRQTKGKAVNQGERVPRTVSKSDERVERCHRDVNRLKSKPAMKAPADQTRRKMPDKARGDRARVPQVSTPASAILVYLSMNPFYGVLIAI